MKGRTHREIEAPRQLRSLSLAGALLALALVMSCGEEERPLAPLHGDPATPPATPTPVAVPVAATAVPENTPAPLAAPALKPSLSPESLAAGSPMPAHIAPPPTSDLIGLARRFRPGQVSQLAEPPVYGASDVGSVEEFWVIDLVRLRVEKISATLRLVTPHALWFTAGDSVASQRRIETLAAHFEERVYPRVTQAVLGYVPERASRGLGAQTTMLIAPLSGAAGYFASGDYYTPGVYPFSNGRPVLYLDARFARSNAEAFAGLTGHEYQHLLHYLVDPTEHTWVHEGIAELTAGLVAHRPPFPPPGFGDEVSLINWPAYGAGLARHYGAAHLFFAYFSQRYGAEALADVVARPEDGVEGIEAYLRASGRPESFDRLFQDWAAANLLGGDAPLPYGYADDSLLTPLSPRHSLSPDTLVTGTIAPFAADYVTLDLPAEGGVLSFSGDAVTSILDADPYSGAACWWSNRGDASHSRLSREFDLSDVSSATLSFRIWHNLEALWDYLYVTASGDGGMTWQVLPGEHTVADDPVGATYGPGITGQSGGWLEERVDLSSFAGGKVLVSFDQVLDAAISLDGACIDDIAVPEAGFFDDAETDSGWTAEGFVRINNILSQRFGVRVVVDDGRGGVTAHEVVLDGGNAGSLALPALPPGASATAIVTSLTRHTSQRSSYTLRLTAMGE